MENSLPVLSDRPGLRVIVLAGQPHGGADPLAERFGQTHRSLVPIAGQPLIAHVLRTAFAHPQIASLAICIEREAFDAVWDVLTQLPGRGAVTLVPSRGNLADSVRDAAQGWEGPLIVTTGDHALLSEQAIDAVAGALQHADAVIALTPRKNVEAVHPSVPRRFLALRDGEFAACDLYGIANRQAIDAADVFRANGGFDRAGSRIRRAAGILGLVLMRCRLLHLASAARLASRHLGISVTPVIVADGKQAIDVGDDRSYAIVRDLLEQKKVSALPAWERKPGSAGYDRAFVR